MKISTMTDLVAAIQDMLVGNLISDQTACTFVALAEAEFARTVRARQMIRRATTILVDGYTELPSDFLAPINLTLISQPGTPLRMISADQADVIRSETPAGGIPAFWTIMGTQIEALPNPNGKRPVELVYYGRPRPLAMVTNETNLLFALAPDLYLMGALAQAGLYINDPQRASIWRSEADRLIAQINFDASTAALGASPLMVRQRSVY